MDEFELIAEIFAPLATAPGAFGLKDDAAAIGPRPGFDLIVTTDHGRGDAPVERKSHGEKVQGSEFTWMGFLGPDTPALGERSNVDEVNHSQIAATLAAMLGHDYAAEAARAGKPVPPVVDKSP